MMKKLWFLFFATLVAAYISVPLSFAQPCSPQTGIIHLGESFCLQVCTNPGSYVYTLEGGGRPGDANRPILTFGAGCDQATTNCDVVCTPLTPPDTLILGGDEFDLESYYGENDCFIIHLYWDHDDVWTIEIEALCNGCLCITYDRQLPVNLLEFTAHANANTIDLRWTTASELESDRFEIRRDGATVGSVDAAGTTMTETRYVWSDEHVVAGASYDYALVEVSIAGEQVELGRIRATAATPEVVTQYALYQNYPNPFNPETSIQFDLAESGWVSLKVFNPIGQVVATLINSNMGAGKNTVRFNAASVGSGVYLYKLEAGSFSDTKKMVVLK